MVFIKAVSVFLGTVIGVGIFGLPFVALRAGFFVILIYFLVMALVAIAVHFIYGEVALGTKELHRLPGYVGQYLGPKWKSLSFLTIIVGLMGTLIAYLIVGGEFLNHLLSPYFGGNALFYTILFFSLGAYLIFRGIKSISWVELVLLAALLIIIGIFFVKAFPHIDVDHFKSLDLKYIAFPYGVVLFSIWGSALVPEMKEMISSSVGKKDRNKVRKLLRMSIFWSIVFATIVYLLFVLIVLGASGTDTSKEAISGLHKTLGDSVIKLGFIFGIISCFTSFITLSLTLKKVFWYDLGVSRNLSWALTCFFPLILFLLGLRQFIEIIGFTGALALGGEAIITIFLYRAFQKKVFSKKINPAGYFLVAIFVVGIVLEITYFITLTKPSL